jgi:hypothetical protein
MRRFANQLRWTARIGLLVLFLAFSTSAQVSVPQPGRRGPLTGADEQPPDSATIEMERKQLKLMNEERQKHLVADTDKLLQLASELRSDANSPGKTAASANLAHKASEIEKLAKGIRSKMTIAP